MRAHLKTVLAAEWPGFDMLARQLGMTPVTLRQRLRSEGQIFASIKDEMRSALAQSLLHESAQRGRDRVRTGFNRAERVSSRLSQMDRRQLRRMRHDLRDTKPRHGVKRSWLPECELARQQNLDLLSSHISQHGVASTLTFGASDSARSASNSGSCLALHQGAFGRCGSYGFGRRIRILPRCP